MNIKKILSHEIKTQLTKLYGQDDTELEVGENKSAFPGDYSVVIFPLIKRLKKNPQEIGESLGQALLENSGLIADFNVVKGFVNVVLKPEIFGLILKSSAELFEKKDKGETVMVEYSSPNTNKPLHLGHIRNNLLGFSVARILEQEGFDVIRTQIINDRGVHISKSMYAWEKFGNGETPESANLKGDKLVGKYYVEFDKAYKQEIEKLTAEGKTEEEAKKEAPAMLAAQDMLQKWEAGDETVHQLWKMMNQWVYAGFEQTYQRLGVKFDQVQYESNTYLLGKDLIQKGLAQGTFYRKEDGSVWVDLTAEELDEKLLLRRDGTSVYMTQDLGTAVERFEKNDIQRLIYTVGNEQDYHFQVLFAILKKLGYNWAHQLYHLSYGMVELPHGKMKSREGTVVDADDLMQEMYLTAKEKAQELGKLDGRTETEKEQTYERVGMAALKYYMLKVEPKKKMMFNPAESIDFNGNTGPFILYTYARIQSLLAKGQAAPTIIPLEAHNPEDLEKALILQLANYPLVVSKAAESLNPAAVANYLYEVVKGYNSFYQAVPILSDDREAARAFRLELSAFTAEVIKNCLFLLGIETVDRM